MPDDHRKIGLAAAHFVFLQGMPSSFFRRIARALKDKHCRCTHVALCFGDALFWGYGDRVDYRGCYKNWPDFIGRYFDSEGVTDLVLLGEQRLYHKEAIVEAKRRGIRVTVTDFGYLRPDWITLEADGMSQNSLFPKDILLIRREAAGLPVPICDRVYPDSFGAMAIGDLIYSFGNVLMAWLYPLYRRSDRRPNPFVYFTMMGVRILTARRRNHAADETLTSLLARGRRFFIFPLQLEHDFQIVAYSPFANLVEPMEMVMRSFATAGDQDSMLIVKTHPYDPGLRNWRTITRDMARRFSIAERVAFIDGGNLESLLPCSQGMVTVNSTSGVTALIYGKPVKVLGSAIYDMAGLTFAGDLDAFWQRATPPDKANVDMFIRLLAASVQIRGVFFGEPGLSAAVEAAVSRLLHNRVGVVERAEGRVAAR